MRCSWKDQCRDSVLTFVFTFLAEIHEKCIHWQISREDRCLESAHAHPRVRSRSLFRLVALRRRAYVDWLSSSRTTARLREIFEASFRAASESHRGSGHVESRPRTRIAESFVFFRRLLLVASPSSQTSLFDSYAHYLNITD